MKVIRNATELPTGGHKVCLAIGVFDGVHLGHQQVIRQTVADAKKCGAIPIVVTFDQHPSTVVAPHKAVRLIYSLPQRLRVIAGLEVEATLLIRFDRSFSEQSGDTFIRSLAAGFGQIYSICVGSHFTFGHKRSGNVALLKTLGQDLKFIVHGLAALSLDGKVVSSTRIREAIGQGNFDDTSQMLGRAYSVSSRVMEGDKLGRQIGVPTANLDVTGLALPPNGVYAAWARAQETLLPAVLNIGMRPTVSSPEPRQRFEVHLLDFNGDLYGSELEVTFVEKLRDEQKFSSLAALSDQIQRDIAAARKILA